jgi:hypothetical protein
MSAWLGAGSPLGWLCTSTTTVADNSRALDHLAQTDRRAVDRALLLCLVGEQLIALVKEENSELLDVGEGLRGAAIVEHRGP